MQQSDIDRITRSAALNHAIALAGKKIDKGESEDVNATGVVVDAEIYRRFLVGEKSE